nr:hypothetical protein [Tanacetum cinerariifolium]
PVENVAVATAVSVNTDGCSDTKNVNAAMAGSRFEPKKFATSGHAMLRSLPADETICIPCVEVNRTLAGQIITFAAMTGLPFSLIASTQRSLRCRHSWCVSLLIVVLRLNFKLAPVEEERCWICRITGSTDAGIIQRGGSMLAGAVLTLVLSSGAVLCLPE